MVTVVSPPERIHAGKGRGLPVLMIGNHVSWWDGFLVYLLNQKVFRRRVFLMMLEEQLRKYTFFSRLGAYSVDPGKPKSVSESLQYTMKLLEEQNTLITIFPQGELRPWHQRPLGYQRLPEWVAKKANRPLHFLPLAMRLEFRDERKPIAILKTGKLRQVNAFNFPTVGELEQEMTELLDGMLHFDPNWENTVLLEGFRGVSDR